MRELIKRILDIPSIKTNKNQIIILSDDWGSVRIRSKKDQEALVKKGLKIDNRFDKYDTLETNEDLELLFEVLTKYKDQHGNHPVITAVSNVANPDFTQIQGAGFKEYFFETIDQTYQRYPDSDRVLSLVKEGIHNKIFIPQSHGREHVQVNWWMRELGVQNSPARNFFEYEFFFLGPKYLNFSKRNRGIAAAFDVWDKHDLEAQLNVLKSGLEIFQKLYGFSSSVFTPPAMYYNPRLEKTVFDSGVNWLDVGRFFKVPKVGGGESWQINYLGRQKKSGLKVLVRNAVFEPNMLETDNGVSRALYDIESAFKAKQPAILSNHRAAFVGRIDSKNRDKGLKAFDDLLMKILNKWPYVEFVGANNL